MKYKLQGVTCADCAARLERALAQMDSVKSVSVRVATSTMIIECGDLEAVKKKMKEIEPGVTLESAPKTSLRTDSIIIITASILFAGGFLTEESLHNFPYSWPEYTVFLSAYFLTGRKVLKNAFVRSIKGQIFDENFLMTIATGGAILIHQLPEAVGVMLFFSVGEYLENLSVDRSRKSIQALLLLRPEYATVKSDQTLIQTRPEEVEVGAFILIKPGERIPLDGTVTEGYTTVDTSALTGESLPRKVEPNDTVLAGMVNKTGVITVRVTKKFQESALSRILDLVENAAAKKAEPEKAITKFARIYTPVVVAAAFSVAVIPPLVLGTGFYHWVYRSLVLLVISCPCALVISIPLVPQHVNFYKFEA